MGRRRPRREQLGRVAASVGLAVVTLIGVAETGATTAAATATTVVGGNTFATRTACSGGTGLPGAVQSLGPTFYWRLGDPVGAVTVADSSGNGRPGTVRVTGTAANNVALGATSLIWCDTGALRQPAVARAVANAGTVVWTTLRAAPGPNTFTIMAWVQVPAGLATGGRVMGFGNASTGRSTTYDRHLFVDNQGRAAFGIYPGAVRVLRSTTLVNDGKAHFLVATLGPSGGRLYVDGVPQGSDPTWTVAQNYGGYWRVGWDNLAGWGPAGDPVNPTNFGLGGVIDEAAVFEGQELSAAQVAAIWATNHW